MAEHLQSLAPVLQTAERHITDRDTSPDPLWGPVIDGPDLKVMLVGAEADFDFPELIISGNNIQSVQIVCTMEHLSENLTHLTVESTSTCVSFLSRSVEFPPPSLEVLKAVQRLPVASAGDPDFRFNLLKCSWILQLRNTHPRN